MQDDPLSDVPRPVVPLERRARALMRLAVAALAAVLAVAQAFGDPVVLQAVSRLCAL